MTTGKLGRFYSMASAMALGLCLATSVTLSHAADLPAALQAKVTKYQKQLVDWAANPAVVAAAKDANAKGGVLPGMTNAKWNDLEDKDPAVQTTLTSPMGAQIRKWEEDKNINKLFLRDVKANLIAGSSKSLLFNNANRPSAANALKGQAWADSEVKPDPTTQIKSVQITAPVMEGGKVIGILHASVTAD